MVAIETLSHYPPASHQVLRLPARRGTSRAFLTLGEFRVLTSANASRWYEMGCLPPSLDRVVEMLAERPEEGRLWELRGFLHSQRHEWHQGRFALETASMYVPLAPAGRVCLIECYRQTGLTDLATDLAGEMVDDENLPVQLHLALAALLSRVERLGDAVKICQQAISAEPSWAQAWFDLAYYLARHDPRSSSIEYAARRAVQLDPGRVTFRVGLACRLAARDRLTEAYEMVSHLRCEHLQGICCVGCLKKLERIYTAVGDHDRVLLCEAVREQKLAGQGVRGCSGGV